MEEDVRESGLWPTVFQVINDSLTNIRQQGKFNSFAGFLLVKHNEALLPADVFTGQTTDIRGAQTQMGCE